MTKIEQTIAQLDELYNALEYVTPAENQIGLVNFKSALNDMYWLVHDLERL